MVNTRGRKLILELGTIFCRSSWSTFCTMEESIKTVGRPGATTTSGKCSGASKLTDRARQGVQRGSKQGHRDGCERGRGIEGTRKEGYVHVRPRGLRRSLTRPRSVRNPVPAGPTECDRKRRRACGERERAREQVGRQRRRRRMRPRCGK